MRTYRSTRAVLASVSLAEHGSTVFVAGRWRDVFSRVAAVYRAKLFERRARTQSIPRRNSLILKQSQAYDLGCEDGRGSSSTGVFLGGGTMNVRKGLLGLA